MKPKTKYRTALTAAVLLGLAGMMGAGWAAPDPSMPTALGDGIARSTLLPGVEASGEGVSGATSATETYQLAQRRDWDDRGPRRRDWDRRDRRRDWDRRDRRRDWDRRDHRRDWRRPPVIVLPPPPPPEWRRRGVRRSSLHVEWCLSRYRSYDPRTDMYRGYDGVYRYCRSPYR